MLTVLGTCLSCDKPDVFTQCVYFCLECLFQNMTPLTKLRICLLSCNTRSSLLTTMAAKRFTSDWIEASSLILVAKRDQTRDSNISSDDDCDYRVLMAKRSGKMSFMSNFYVFPGGQVDFDDFNGNWHNCFGEKINRTIDVSGPRLAIVDKSVTREQIIASNSNTNVDQLLSPDFALRIAAIRETFEETGIMISTPGLRKLTSGDTIHSYREKLLKSDLKFSDLCNQLSVCPNVWSLYEWSNWLTPTVEKKRFDTMFYMVFIDSEANAKLDEEEMSHFTWCTPKEMLDNYYTRSDTVMAPPQVYELLRLLNITKYSQLKQFAADRQRLGLNQLLPKLIYKTANVAEKIKFTDLLDNEFISLLPGDELYNSNDSDDCSNSNSNETELSRQLYHRLRFRDSKFFTQCTIDMPYGHLSPISYKAL